MLKSAGNNRGYFVRQKDTVERMPMDFTTFVTNEAKQHFLRYLDEERLARGEKIRLSSHLFTNEQMSGARTGRSFKLSAGGLKGNGVGRI
jgi:hypothetical protein